MSMIDPNDQGGNAGPVVPPDSQAGSGTPSAEPAHGTSWRSPVVLGLAGIVVILIIALGVSLGINRGRSASPIVASPGTGGAAAAGTSRRGPLPIVLRTTPVGSPTAITALPTSADAGLFAHPTEPAYVPGKGFAPDAQRVLDIAALQISLEKYRHADGRYPAALSGLFPGFAPLENGQPLSAAPTDPVTHQPYAYTVASDGSSYQLSATLSNGQHYAGFSRTGP